jgi:hypothetical protein
MRRAEDVLHLVSDLRRWRERREDAIERYAGGRCDWVEHKQERGECNGPIADLEPIEWAYEQQVQLLCVAGGTLGALVACYADMDWNAAPSEGTPGTIGTTGTTRTSETTEKQRIEGSQERQCLVEQIVEPGGVQLDLFGQQGRHHRYQCLSDRLPSSRIVAVKLREPFAGLLERLEGESYDTSAPIEGRGVLEHR